MDARERAARLICRRLNARGHRALLAGGCVRDRVLGRTPKDYDVATSARPEEVSGVFERTVQVGAAFGVVMVILPEGRFEVATFRRDGPYPDARHPSEVTYSGEREDAQRRDFTINALFFDPEEERVLDYVGGLADLRRGVLRTVGNPRERFAEDHLRLVRAVRFAARLGFAMAPETHDALRAMAHLATTASSERIRDEMLLCLTEGGARRAFELMDETGLLPHLLPEVSAMKGVEQPPEFHPEGDVFTHTLLMLGLLDRVPAPSPTLALAVLLHDVGKPPTQVYADRIRFNGHEKTGALMAERICRRLRLSNEQADRVVWLVRNHMRTALMPRMREAKRKRLLREPGFGELLELLRVDALGSHGELDAHAWIVDYAANLKEEELRPAPLITGHDLIKMGYTPGPGFARMLTAVEDAQLDGRLSDPESARRFISEQWPPGGGTE